MAPGGRSTGCKTCRTRHLKCDEARPICNRCQKAGIECRGYDVIEVFVDERSKILERGSRHRADRRKQPGSPNNGKRRGELTFRGHVTNPSISVPDPRKDDSPSPSSAPSSPSSPSSTSSEDVVDSMTMIPGATVSPLFTVLPLLEDDIYLTFMLRKMFVRAHNQAPDSVINIRSQAPNRTRGTWLLPMITQGRAQAPLGSALSALSRAWFAKSQNQPTVAAQGMGHYSKALLELKRAISDDTWRQRNVLLAAMLLALYETVTMEETNAWVNHTRGLAHLFQAQGPDSFQDEMGIGILRANRYGMIMSAIMTGERSFLERPEWRTVPWQPFPQMKDDTDFLFDVLATVPGLVKRVVSWEAQPAFFPQKALDGILTSLRELCEWRWGYEMSNQATIRAYENASEEPSVLFARVLDFDAIMSAHVISLYESTLIILLLLAQRLRGPDLDLDILIGPPPAELIKSNALILPGVDSLDIVEIAREICRTIKYRMQHMKSSAIAFSLLLPMRVTWQILREHPAEAQWLRSVAIHLEEQSALQFQRLMLETSSSNLFPTTFRLGEAMEIESDAGSPGLSSHGYI